MDVKGKLEAFDSTNVLCFPLLVKTLTVIEQVKL